MQHFIFLSLVSAAAAAYFYFAPPRNLAGLLGIREKKPAAEPFWKLKQKTAFLSNLAFFEKYAKKAIQRGTTISAEKIAFLTLTASFTAFAGGMALFRLWWLAVVLAAAVFVFVPRAVLNFESIRMEKIIDEQLPSVIFTLISSIKAGSTLLGAIKTAGEDHGYPLGSELLIVYESVKHGEDLNSALEKMARRLGDHDAVRRLVLSINIAANTGGSIISMLDAVSKMVSERNYAREMARSFSTQGLISAAALSIVPIASLFALNEAMPGAVSEFFYGSVQGKLVLFFCFCLIMLGWLSIYYMLQKNLKV